MTLGQKQRLFTKLITELLLWAHKNGYEFSLGDAYRDHRVHGSFGEKKSYSSAVSMHKLRLAIDLNLFIDGVYQTTTESHKDIGLKWESMHELCSWGGHFGDGNHYSFRHRGYR
jgi:hypothetical protein